MHMQKQPHHLSVNLIIWAECQIICTHVQGWQIIFNFNEVLNRVSNSADNTVNDMHNSIGCNLVAVDYPGTVDCHHLYVLIVGTERRISANASTGLLGKYEC